MADRVSLTFKGGAKMDRVLKKMEKGLNGAQGVTVGFLADKQYPKAYGTRVEHRITPERTTTSVAQVAFWDEFGNKRIPARPYFRTMIEEKSPSWGDSMAYLARVHGYDGKKIMTNMGIGIQAQLVASIRNWTDPANSPVTVKIKGFNKPLVDEGILQNSVEYRVTARL